MSTNKFNQMQGLTEKVAVIVPSTIDVNKEIDNKEAVRAVLMSLSNLFGGASAIEQEGGWVSQTHGLVVESNTMVYAYASELTNDDLNHVYTLAEQLAYNMNQEAIAVEINNNLYFVEQSEQDQTEAI